MPFISYAQNREDVVLHRVLAGRSNGFYIDVGANDPVVASVTKAFYDLGWRGINIEPVHAVFRRLAADRLRDINLEMGISNCSKTISFFECESSSTHSTFCPVEAEHRARLGLKYQVRHVPVMTLAQVCEQHVRGAIDFLSIDAENLEREVIEGNDWARWRPQILVIEDSLGAETGRPTHDRWEPLLLAEGYLFGLYDGINRFYIRKEDESLLPLLQIPANAEDNFVTHETVCLQSKLEAAQMRLLVYGETGYAPILARNLRNALERRSSLYRASKRVVRSALSRWRKSDAA